MKYLIVSPRGEILLKSGRLPEEPLFALPGKEHICSLDAWHPGADAVAFGIDEPAEAPEGCLWTDIRTTWTILGKEDFDAAVHASMWVYWNRTTRYCSVCGNPLKRTDDIAKKCDTCGREYYPQIAPAVIVRVNRGDTTLLARAALRPAFFGLISGFVEGGETFEECVVRELREETGIEITNLRYFGSQSWPFPSGIMIGYTADYLSGDIDLGDGELLEAGFYTREQVRQMPIPKPFSISRRLIDQWLNSDTQSNA